MEVILYKNTNPVDKNTIEEPLKYYYDNSIGID